MKIIIGYSFCFVFFLCALSFASPCGPSGLTLTVMLIAGLDLDRLCGQIAECTGLNPDPRKDREGPSCKTREGIISVTKDPNNLLWDCDEFRLVLLQQ